jgi:hypothetical protein
MSMSVGQNDKCGNTVNVVGTYLTQGHTKSCGCLSREFTSQRKRNNLVNQIFGRLRVIEEVGSDKRSRFWLVECQCDKRTKFVVKTSRLLSGNASSCGCLKTENKIKAARETAKKRVKLKNCLKEFIHLVDPNKFVENLEIDDLTA